MRWLRRDPIIKISVIIVVLMTIIISMNLIELLNKYVKVSLTPDSGIRYEYQVMKELHYTIPDPYESEDSVGNDVIAKEKAAIKEILRDFFSNMPDFSGNVAIPLVYFKFNEGVDVSAEVLLSCREELPYNIDYKNDNNDNNEGIFIGNSYNGYWDGDSITLNGEEIMVAGVISSVYLTLDNSVIVPYKILNGLAKDRLLDSLTNDVFYDRKIPICFSSNHENVISYDVNLMEKYIVDKGLLEIKNVGEDTEKEIELEKDDTPIIYSFIKNIVCIISALFCFVAIFEVIRLFLNRKKKDITILWRLGVKKIILYRILIRELGLAILLGVILAFLSEFIIYGLIMKCSFLTIILYGIYACIIVVLIAFIMMAGITNHLLKRCAICEIKE